MHPDDMPTNTDNDCLNPTFQDELAKLVNKHGIDTDTNTPDHVLAEYLCSCLSAYELALAARKMHAGQKLELVKP